MKKVSDTQIRLIVLIAFLLTPFLLAYLGLAIHAEWLGRLIGLAILIVGLPLLILWLVINPKYKKSFGASIKGKRYTLPGRIIGLILAFLLLILSRNFALDMLGIFKNGIPSKTGKIIETRHNPYTFLVRGQYIYLENEPKAPLTSIFSPYLARTGDHVEIKYLPRTKFVIEIIKNLE